MRSIHGLMIGAILCAMTLTGCREQAAEAEQAPVSVKVKAVEMNSVNNGVRYSANIIPNSQVELAFKVGGYVERVLQMRGVDGRMRDVQAGDLVTRGTVLARVRQSDYAVKAQQAEAQSSEASAAFESSKAQFAEAQSAITSSRAQLAEAEAAFERARLEFDRARSLFASQSLTRTDYDTAKAQFDAGEAKRNAARAQVAMVEAKANAAGAQVEVTRAKVKGSQALVAEAAIPLQDTSLRAPMNAVVLQRAVEAGELVSQGKPGFTLADTTSVKAVFGVPDLTVNKLKLGSGLTVTTEALPGAEFRGQITGIAPAADAKSRVFEIEVTIPNPDRALKAGMIASLELAPAAPPQPVTVVPISAVVRARNQPDQYAVFVVEEKGGKQIARSRVVRLGAALGNTIIVLEGVSVGERVIITGAAMALDGQAVQVVP